ncbi:DNA ligase LigA-related protein [Rhodoblastus acidophilus]|uniref:DNA ligase LigA-related protein n=1 Tax=Rhodoblastus acidophilus TaxID=1074 RepID=UPI003CD04DE9
MDFLTLSHEEIERRRRIRLTIAAYAYEFENESIMSDHEFDKLSQQVDLSITTGRLDDWWRDKFHPDTGQWIHDHPELDKVREVYHRVFKQVKPRKQRRKRT